MHAADAACVRPGAARRVVSHAACALQLGAARPAALGLRARVCAVARPRISPRAQASAAAAGAAADDDSAAPLPVAAVAEPTPTGCVCAPLLRPDCLARFCPHIHKATFHALTRASSFVLPLPALRPRPARPCSSWRRWAPWWRWRARCAPPRPAALLVRCLVSTLTLRCARSFHFHSQASYLYVPGMNAALVDALAKSVRSLVHLVA